ncbi:DUF3238 domain-containing protein [Sporosarcina sp. CAU 1771]
MEDFEIQTVVNRADLIQFKWNDLGGTYNVYRDGILLYEGTVPEFSDGDFKHAKMYSYAIERVEHGEVVDVIALQTSAYAEKRNVENPLQFLVLTTIVAKTKIALCWERIKDIDRYDVFRNNVLLETVHTNQYIDQDFSLDETYTYSIFSNRPLAESIEPLSFGKSIIARAIGKMHPFSSKGEAEVENFKMIKVIDKPRKLLTPVMDKRTYKSIDDWHFLYTTFLKDKWIKNPNLLSLDSYFEGDGRGFHPEGKGFRTRVDIELAYNKAQIPMKFTKETGRSASYTKAGRLRKSEFASKEGIFFKRLDHGKEEAGFLLTHAVGNPLISSPVIDYEVRAVMRRDGTFDMTGFHDQAPHHEIYLKQGEKGEWVAIHQAESRGLAWMSPVMSKQYWRISNFE